MGYQESLITLNEAPIKDLICIIRGQRVMLDFDLACICGYETKRFNEQIRNNIAKFDDDFMFRLTLQEWDSVLRSKKSTANNLAKRRYPPYAFNEQGIYMLMTVLRGDLAVQQSKALIRLFKPIFPCRFITSHRQMRN